MERTREYPPPTEPEPTIEQIGDWVMDVEDTLATDGCTTEPDGWCEHGHPSWMLRLGII